MRITHFIFLCLSSASVIQKLIKLTPSYSSFFFFFFCYMSALFVWPLKFQCKNCPSQHLCATKCKKPAWVELWVQWEPAHNKVLSTNTGVPFKLRRPLTRQKLSEKSSFILSFFPFSRVFLTVPGSKGDIWSWRKEATCSQVDTLPAIITNPEIGIFTLIWMIRCKYKF